MSTEIAKDDLLVAAAEYRHAYSELNATGQLGGIVGVTPPNFFERLKAHEEATQKLQLAAIAWAEALYD